MSSIGHTVRRRWWMPRVGWVILACCLACMGWAIDAVGAESAAVRILDRAGKVEITRDGGLSWDPAQTNQAPLLVGNRIRTGERSRATLQLGDLSVLQLGELTSLTIQPPRQERSRFQLLRGLIYFFHRDQPGDVEIETPGVAAAVRGTEFVLEVSDDELSTLRLLDGEVDFYNDKGLLRMNSGDAAEARPNAAPRPLPAISVTDPRQVQWFLYYPAVLDPVDLRLTPREMERYRPALEAYRLGDLRAAGLLFDARGPDPASAPSTALQLFSAALDLSFGRIEAASAILRGIAANPTDDPHSARLAEALLLLVQAVHFRVQAPPAGEPATATEFMARSYARQSRRELNAALRDARAATALSPAFGFAQARLAELEFGFGRIQSAQQSLAAALMNSPRNAQAVALSGFIHIARNEFDEAEKAFNEAIALDGGLGNGWLGRGLVRIRRGHASEGRQDLETAAAMEPQRALLRSYLGKAFDADGNEPKARHELELARRIDPLDPTSWFYLALLDQNTSRVNDAIRGLAEAQARNENRALFRSQLLLDQDRASRGARLASVYRDAAMEEAGVREASRSVAAAPSDPSSHLFLAQSYLSSDRVNLRYESPRVSEFLTANLLAPPGSANSSPTLSQQEFSSLFERDGLSLFSNTEYRSNGRWSESAALVGAWQGSDATIDTYRVFDPGHRANNRLDQSALSIQYKQQVTPADTLYVQPLWSEARSGDLVEYYDPVQANPDLTVRETQSPIFLAGWRHEWSPSSKTLVLFSRLQDTLEVNDPSKLVSLVLSTPAGPVFRSRLFSENHTMEFEGYAGELQHILSYEHGDTIIGARAMGADFEGRTTLVSRAFDLPPGAVQDTPMIVGTSSDRVSLYAYQSLQVLPFLRLTAGVAWDHLDYPLNTYNVPLTVDSATRSQLSPKAGLSLDLWRGAGLRGAYSQSLGGVGFDQSFRLEPTQIAGLNQTYRSLIPESVAGSSPAERFETADLVLEQKLGTNTWLFLAANWLHSTVDREVGSFQGNLEDGLSPVGMPNHLRFRERNASLTANRLLGRDWAVGATYRVSEAVLESSAPGLSPALAGKTGLLYADESVLQQASLFGVFNHPSGIFVRAEATWNHQDLNRDLAVLQGDDFWQVNLQGGWRFAHRRAQLGLGVLNLGGSDYRLHPLNLHPLLSHERTFVATFQWTL